MRGVSQNEMEKRAIILGWQSTLHRIEAKKVDVTFRTLVLVAPIFGLSPAEIMNNADIHFAESSISDNINYSEIGKIIQARRKSLHMTEEELSLQIDSNSSWVIYMEKRFPRSITANSVIALDKILEFDGKFISLLWNIVDKELAEK